jgi:hypothetical protein
MPDVFLIHAQQDRGRAEAVKAALERQGLGTCSAADARVSSEAAPAEAPCVVFLWSRAAQGSPSVEHEIKHAIRAWSDDRLVLARLDDAELPVGLRDLDGVALNSTAAAEALAVRVRALLRPGLADAYASTVAAAPGRYAPRKSGSPIAWVFAGAAAFVTGWMGWFLLSNRFSGALPPLDWTPQWDSRTLGPIALGIALLLGTLAVIRAVSAIRRRIEALPALVLSAPAAGDGGRARSAAQHQVFVSYSYRDIAAVDEVVRSIEHAGFSVWLDRNASRDGQRYAAPIVKAIKSAKVVALMCSRNSFASDHVIREVYVAGDYRKPFLAFQLDRSEVPDELNYFLSGFPRVPVDGGVSADKVKAEITRFVLA